MLEATVETVRFTRLGGSRLKESPASEYSVCCDACINNKSKFQLPSILDDSSSQGALGILLMKITIYVYCFLALISSTISQNGYLDGFTEKSPLRLRRQHRNA